MEIVQNEKPIETEEAAALNSSSKGFLALLIIGCSFLVFNVGGYNDFIPRESILISRVSVVGILLLSTFILYRSKGRWHEFWRLSFFFMIASLGFLLAWFFGRWYQLIPGLSTSTVEGAAVAKVAEVLPIVSAILVGLWLVEKDFAYFYLRGGDLKKSIKIGLLVSPAGLYAFVLLGGFGFSASLDTLATWIPWLIVFAFSNAFMEELMIRGLFLRRYESLFGRKQSLILTSVIFALFHLAIIGFTDFITFWIYLSIPLVLGLLWGYTIQKSENIWGAVLAHLIADVIFVLAIFGV
ncbi:MAG: lysostaphin resistance A-like protein [Candidatus Thorarchaeota archaeon]